MSAYMGDITNYLSAGNVNSAKTTKSASDSMGLDMTDFLTLMVTQLTSQTMDQTADTSDMLNQLVQMQMVQALTNMTDASIMSYAASLVGKEVTVGQYDSEGNLQEVVGVVSGTGTYGGEQVVFIDDKYYYMSEIMAVGRLPEIEEEEGAQPDSGESTPVTPDVPETPDGTETPESSLAPEVPEVPDVPEIPETPEA